MKCQCGADSRVARHDGKSERLIDTRMNQMSRVRKCARGHTFKSIEVDHDEMQRLRRLAHIALMSDVHDAARLRAEAERTTRPVPVPKASTPAESKRKRRRPPAEMEAIKDAVLAGDDMGLTPAEAAKKYNISRGTIYHWRASAA